MNPVNFHIYLLKLIRNHVLIIILLPHRKKKFWIYQQIFPVNKFQWKVANLIVSASPFHFPEVIFGSILIFVGWSNIPQLSTFYLLFQLFYSSLERFHLILSIEKQNDGLCLFPPRKRLGDHDWHLCRGFP